jgi:PAS domain S-box-containing protein
MRWFSVKYISVILFFITGLIISWKFYQIRYEFESSKLVSGFRQIADERALAIRADIEANISVLSAVRALFDTAGVVSRQQFQTFAKPLLSQHKGVRALAWIPRIAHKDRQDYRIAAQKQFPNFQIMHKKSDGSATKIKSKAEYFPLYYLEFYRGNEADLGVDVSEDSATLKLLNRVRDTGKTLALSRVRNYQGKKGAELFVYMPVYKRGSLSRNEAERQKNFLGFVLGVYRVSAIVVPILHQHPGRVGLNLDVLNMSAPKGEQLLFSTKQPVSSVPQSSTPANMPHYEFRFNFGGKIWGLQFTPLSNFYTGTLNRIPWLDFLLGLIITILLSIYLWSILGRSEKTRLLAQELEHAKTYVDNIIASMSNMLLVFDPNWMIKTVNRTSLSKLNYNEGSLVGQSIDVLLSGEKDAIKKKMKALAYADEGNGVAVTLITKEDKDMPVIIFVSPMYNDKHKVRAFVCVAEDLTELKRLEKEKDVVKQQLFQSQKLEAIGQLAGGIAHDFNNILNVILGEVELVKNKKSVLDDTVQERLKIIKISAERAASLTQKLLGFARRGNYEKKPLSLNELIKETYAILSNTIDKTIHIDLQLATSLWMLEGDSSQLSQVLMNLCLNARDAMPAGGALIVKTSNLNADEAYCSSQKQLKPGRYVRLSITDTGTGIKKENVEKIYEPFFTTKALKAGTGLGLSLVYGIVKSHDGCITVYSETDEGTTFNVYFPACEGAEQENQGSSNDVDVNGLKGTRLLVIDDEHFLLEIIQEMLSASGMHVICEASPVQGLSIFEKEHANLDVVLLDIAMPEMSGHDVFEKIRAIDKKQPIILMSGYAESEKIQAHREQGIAGFLQKPYVKADLMAEIQHVLALRKESPDE